MSVRRPPRLATWLLDRLGHTRQNAALAGDLLEEFAHGRSRTWFWRQALMVMASGTGRNAVLLRPYLSALVVGFAVQVPATYLLWRLQAPREVHGLGPDAAAGLAIVAGFVLLAEVQRFVVRGDTANLKLLVCTANGSLKRRASAWISFETFSTHLLCYCICAFFFRHFSLPELAGGEAAWLLMLTTSPLLSAPAARKEPEPPTPIKYWPAPELSLTVALEDGRLIVLEPDTFALTAFGAADKELIATLFGHATTREILRRAIWLACAQRYQQMLRDSEASSSVTVRELTRFIEDALG